MSRREDTGVSINERWQMANSLNADLFISVHVNSSGGTGVETIIPTGSLGLLRFTKMTAVYPELAFIDNPAHNPDVDILRFRRQEMAQALSDGIQAFLSQ